MANRDKLVGDKRGADGFKAGITFDYLGEQFQMTNRGDDSAFPSYQKLQEVAGVYGCTVTELRKALPISITTKDALYLLTSDAVEEATRLAHGSLKGVENLPSLLLKLVEEEGVVIKSLEGVRGVSLVDYESPSSVEPALEYQSPLNAFVPYHGRVPTKTRQIDDIAISADNEIPLSLLLQDGRLVNTLFGDYRDGELFPHQTSHGVDLDFVAEIEGLILEQGSAAHYTPIEIQEI